MVEYKRIGESNHQIRRSTVVVIKDSERSTFLVLTNGNILHPKEHTLHKVKMYDTTSKTSINNPYKSWSTLTNACC